MPVVDYTVIDGEILSENRAGVKRDYVPDPLGSTVALLDNTQVQTDTFTYWPYGEEKSRTGTTATPFRFVGTYGYYRDLSGRAYVRARTLRTDLTRWLTEDQIGYDGGDLNVFRYANADPATFIDRWGLMAASGQKPCSDLLKNAGDLPKDLLNCILQSNGNKEKIEECIKKFKDKIKDKGKDAIIAYLACIAASTTCGKTRGGRNPCDPPETDDVDLCHTCCYDKYLDCVMHCMGQKNVDLGICLAKCKSDSGIGKGRKPGLESCMTTCDLNH
jgi:RHS repeat-associated protein